MNDRVLKTALVQFRRDRFDKESNRSRATSILSGIKDVDLVCMPEVWMGGVVLEEAELTNLAAELAEISTSNNITILTGGLFTSARGEIRDVCHVISPGKGISGAQEKIFPSGAVGERKFCRGGEAINIFEVKGIKFGVAVCVDMFYPEIIRALALGGADIVFNPSNIPESRNEMWRALVRTRAAENTIFAAYINNTGTEYADGRKVSGASLVAGPDGLDCASAGTGETVIVVDMDISLIQRQRERWPYLNDASHIKIEGRSILTNVASSLDKTVQGHEPD